MLTDISQDATINIKDVSIDEITGIRSKEYGRPHKVFRRSPTCSGSLTDDETVERMTATVSLKLTKRSGLRCCNVARANAVTLDVVLTKF